MLDPPNNAVNDRRIEALLLHREIEEFNNAYAAALDESRLVDWAEMFTDDGFYVVISRENADRNMPVGLIYCENKGMLLDRANAMKTEMFAPRYLRHIVGNLQVLGEEQNGEIRARANYVVIQVLFDRPDAKMHQVGVYYDRFRRVGATWSYQIVAAGFKYNLPDLAAAIGVAQLERAHQFQAARQAAAERYLTRLESLPIDCPIPAPARGLHAWHLFPIRIHPGARVGRA